MRVKVRPMRRFGRQFLSNEHNALPPHVGTLRVGEVRDLNLDRQVLRAQLVDLRSGALLWEGKARASTAEQQNQGGGLIGALIEVALFSYLSRIIDLAQRMVELSGLQVKSEQNPTGDIEIQITGLRPGEKLYEELLIGDDTQPTQHPRILRAREAFRPWSEFEHTLQVLDQALSAQDVPAARALLQACVHGYQPTGDVVDWVHTTGAHDMTASRPQQLH
mgnify:CR=1 FL=1